MFEHGLSLKRGHREAVRKSTYIRPANEDLGSIPTNSTMPTRQTQEDRASDDPLQRFHEHCNATQSSISTTATAPNLPGAGRTNGLLYDSGGRVLETQLGRIAWAAGLRLESALVPFHNLDLSSQSSISTNATAPDLPGPGRALGLLYQFLGNILEKKVSRIAERSGLGPREVSVRIRKEITRIHWARIGLPYSVESSFHRKSRSRLEKASGKLVKYAVR